MRRILTILPLLLTLSCVHAQVKQQFGGTGSIGGVAGIQSNVTPVFQITNSTTSCPQGTLFSPYTCQLSTANGNGNVSYSIISGSLPNGTSIVGSQIVGTSLSPNAGQYTFTLKATDSASTPNTATLPGMVINVGCPPVALSSPLVLPPAQQSTGYSFTFQESGGVSPFTFSSIGPLPTGETLSSAGVLSGTPTIASNNSFSVSVADSCNLGAQTDTATFSEKVNSNLAVTTASLPSGVALSPYNQTLSVAGGTGPYIWTLSSGPLPNGLSLLSSGVISGTPTTPGVFPVTVTVTDALSNAASANLSITITCRPLSIATQSPLPSCTQGQNYNFTMNASPAGFGALSWTAPGLPSIGLAISNSGVITGTCSQVGTLNATINVSDSCPVQQTQSGQFAITISAQPLNITTSATLSPATQGQSYSQQMQATGGVSPYTWSATGLPSGLSISSTGVISGTATISGTFNPSITVKDFQNTSSTSSFTLVISCTALTLVSTSPLPQATQGQLYSFTFTASGGPTPYSWSLIGGSFPTGLSLATNGTLSGTPSSTGVFSPQVQVTDSCAPTAQTQNTTFSLTSAANSGVLTISTTSPLPGATENVAYSNQLVAVGGTPPYTWSLQSGTPPTGITLSAGGSLSGTPTAAGTSVFTAKVTDNIAGTVTKSLSLTVSCVALAITSTSPLPSATQNSAYSFQLISSGGTGAVTWGATGVPAGLTLSASGKLSGTPTGTGTFTINATATDSCLPSHQTASTSFSLTVSAPIPQLGFSTTSPLQTPTTGIQFTQQVNGQGGVPPYTFALIGGSFPAGISMNINGLISGTATQAATTSPILQVTDTRSVSFSQTFSMTSVCATLSNNTASLSAATQGSAYSAQINASGGSGALSYTASGLPTGLSIGLSTGLISGTPSTSGSFTVTVTITDSCSPTPQSLPKTYTLNVNTNLAITTPSLPNGTQGSAYSGTISAAGGQTPYSFAVTAGAQPTSLSLSAAGVLSGTPSAAGTFNFTVTVTDGLMHTAAQAYTVIVAASGAATCGAGAAGVALANQNACGNYAGAPYEDLSGGSPSTPPSITGSGTLHIITACTTIVPAAGDVWRFGADINDGAGGTNQNCIHFAGQGSNNWVLDMAGHTLTGGMNFDQSLGGHGIGGITIVNGTINCTLANGGNQACILASNGGNLAASFLITHVTVNNLVSPTHPAPQVGSSTCGGVAGYCGFELAVDLLPQGASTANCPAGQRQKTFNGACVEVTHSTISEASGYTGGSYTSGWCARCTALGIFGVGGVTVEVWNNLVGNQTGWIDAHQGVVLFRTGNASVHNNNMPFVAYHGSSDSGRPILVDCAGKPFCNSATYTIQNNDITAFNNRCVRTRLANGVQILNNRFEHVSAGVVFPCIQMGGNGDYAEKLDKTLIASNTFTMAGGNAIQAANAYGMTADSNLFTCDSSCGAGILAAAWSVDNNVFPVTSASRTAGCVVTLVAGGGFGSRTTSLITGLFVNVSGTSSSFDAAATAGSAITTFTPGTSTITYTQAGCSGAASIGAGGSFWISQIAADAFAGNGAGIYVKNSVIDPLLTMTQPLAACGTGSPSCTSTPQTTLNGGQTQIEACNNLKSAVNVPAVGGTGALVQNLTGTCP